MNRTISGALVLALSTMAGADALAGKSKKTTVKITSSVDPADGKTLLTATGGLRAARASSNSTEYIMCKVTNRIEADFSRSPFMTCIAQDKSGNTATCENHTPVDVANAAAINETSVITFTVKLGAKPNCRDFAVENDSRNL